jgi:peptide methionine sulfoxide reductase MsrB
MARKATHAVVLSSLIAILAFQGCGGFGESLGHNPECLQEKELLFGAEHLRDRHEYVCCANEKYAEPSGSLERTTLFADVTEDTVFYDAQCGVPLFKLGARSLEKWKDESRKHGWPSFRDDEVVELGTNVLERGWSGEVVSSCGTHLGHNLPDSKGNRYCINLLCVAGHPADADDAADSETPAAEGGTPADQEVAVSSAASTDPADCLQEEELLYGAESLRERHEYVCCDNKDFAEPGGSLRYTTLFDDVTEETIFYDAQCGVPLFKLGARSLAEWKDESFKHGWPSFRDDEIIGLGTNVIIEPGYNGEIVSSCGTHLGHNLPDSKGNRHCINLLCMAGRPAGSTTPIPKASTSSVSQEAPSSSSGGR